jgi:hypothetical protein
MQLRNFLVGISAIVGLTIPSTASASDAFYSGGRGGWRVEGNFRSDHGRPVCTGRSPSGRPFISISRQSLEPPAPEDDVLSLMVTAFQKTSFNHGQKFLVTGTFNFREDGEDKSQTYQLKATVLKAGNGDTLYSFAVPTFGSATGSPMFLVDITRSFTFTLNVLGAEPVIIDLTGSNVAMNDIMFSCPRAYKRRHRQQ